MQHQRRWALLLPIVVLISASLACGGFQVRVTPTPTLEPGQAPTEEPTPAFAASPQPTEAPQAAAPTQPPAATATVAPTAAPLMQQARVLATGGLNVRDAASSKGKLVGHLAPNGLATVLEGPKKAENYDWYRVQGGGITGWVAAGPANDPWLKIEQAQAAVPPTATAVALKLVDRAIKAGDRVQVTTESTQVLTVRQDAGKGARAVAKVPRGTLFTIKSGPVQQDGLTWWELQSDTVNGWAAEGDGKTRWLTPVE
jgi:SH3-like domain-containing protein